MLAPALDGPTRPRPCPTATVSTSESRPASVPVASDGLVLSPKAKESLLPPPVALPTTPTLEGSAGTRAALDLLKLANVSWNIFRQVSGAAEQISRSRTNAPAVTRAE